VDSILHKKTKEKNQDSLTNDTTVQCQHCNAIITFEKTKNEKISIKCPSCKKKLKIGALQKKPEKKKKNQNSFTSNIKHKISKSKNSKLPHKFTHLFNTIPKKNKNEKNQQNKKSDTNIHCRHCNIIITLTNTKNKKIMIPCPICGKKLRTGTLQNKLSNKKIISLKKIQTFLTSNIVELVLILFGVSFLINPTLGNIKISITLILIGSILLLFMSNAPSLRKENKIVDNSLHFKKDKKGTLIKQKTIKLFSNKYVKNMVNSLSDKIAIILIFWTLLLFVITSGNQVEIFFILIFIGFLITRELTDDLATITLKHRLDGYIIVFLLAYVFVISEKIINILSM